MVTKKPFFEMFAIRIHAALKLSHDLAQVCAPIESPNLGFFALINLQKGIQSSKSSKTVILSLGSISSFADITVWNERTTGIIDPILIVKNFMLAFLYRKLELEHLAYPEPAWLTSWSVSETQLEWL
jgi:hypothetical protein